MAEVQLSYNPHISKGFNKKDTNSSYSQEDSISEDYEIEIDKNIRDYLNKLRNFLTHSSYTSAIDIIDFNALKDREYEIFTNFNRFNEIPTEFVEKSDISIFSEQIEIEFEEKTINELDAKLKKHKLGKKLKDFYNKPFSNLTDE